jgi:osmotically-inducible protein OsmY
MANEDRNQSGRYDEQRQYGDRYGRDQSWQNQGDASHGDRRRRPDFGSQRDRGYYGNWRDDRGYSWGGDYGGYDEGRYWASPGSWRGYPDYGYGVHAGYGDQGRYFREGYQPWRGTYYPGEGYQNRGIWDRTRDEVSSWFGDDDAERRRRMDAMREGEHRGRGPRGYSRSDDRIREDVNDRLTDDAYIDASEIEVTVSSGEVTLNGTVNSRYEKRHAEDIADHISGVKHVQNNLRVQQSGGRGVSGASTMSSTTAGTSH